MDEQKAASGTPVLLAPPKKKRRPKAKRNKPKRQPRYNVILWDDNDHTVDYVIELSQTLFHKTPEEGYQIAQEVDSSGRVILLTTTREHAELKQEQVHAFGPDSRIKNCAGSMWATIEPVPGE